MATILPEHHSKVLYTMAEMIALGADNPLVNFEIQWRMTDVPGNLMDLFFMPKDALQIRNWHVLNPPERFGWVGTMLRLRIPQVFMHFDAQGKLEIYTPSTKLIVDNPLPRRFKNSRNYWKGMDDCCLLVGVAFHLAVRQHGGAELFDDKETIYAHLNSE